MFPARTVIWCLEEVISMMKIMTKMMMIDSPDSVLHGPEMDRNMRSVRDETTVRSKQSTAEVQPFLDVG